MKPKKHNRRRKKRLHAGRTSEEEHEEQAALPRTAGSTDQSFVSNDTTSYLLSKAAFLGQTKKVQRLVAAGHNLENKDIYHRTPLMIAAAQGHSGTVRYILKNGGIVDNSDIYKQTPLMLAAEAGHIEVVRLLMKAGGCLESADIDKLTPLMLAALKGNTNVVCFLLKAGSCVKKTDINHCTALMLAATEGYTDVVRHLLEAGSSLESRNIKEQTPLMLAAARGHKEVMRTLLVAGSSLETLGCMRKAALMWAVKHGHIDVVNFLLEAGGNLGSYIDSEQTLLMLTVEKGYFEMVNILLEAGRYLEKIDYEERTPIMLAAEKGFTNIVHLLLKAGGNLQSTNLEKEAALMIAAIKGHINIVRLFIETKEGLESTNWIGQTPLMLAASKGHVSVVKLLINAGCSLTRGDYYHRTALMLAAANGHVKVVRVLIKVGERLENCNADQQSPLAVAASSGRTNVISKLLVAGANANTRDIEGHRRIRYEEAEREAFEEALQMGYAVSSYLPKDKAPATPASREQSMRVVRLWEKEKYQTYVAAMQDNRHDWVQDIPHNFDQYYRDEAGRTLLHWAAEYGLTIVVRSLLHQGDVSPHVVDYTGSTPYHLAQRAGHSQVIKALEAHTCHTDSRTAAVQYEELLKVIGCGYVPWFDESQEDIEENTQQPDYNTEGPEEYQEPEPSKPKQRLVGEVCKLLCGGTPMEPVNHHACHALHLAISTDRHKLVSLLLASGASLTATSRGLSLLYLAWTSDNVTPKTLAVITRTLYDVLGYEASLMPDKSKLRKGVDALRNTMDSKKPWKAHWPDGSSADLCRLMKEAARTNCPVTASFLYQAGAASPCTEALHAALQEGHWRMAEALVKDMGGCIYLPDTAGCLPIYIMPHQHLHPLEQALYEDEKRKLEDFEERAKSDMEKSEIRDIIHLQEQLFDSYWTREQIPPGQKDNRVSSIALLVASQNDLPQLIYLLLRVNRVEVDIIVDQVTCTTALHQATSHGKVRCAKLLLSVGASLSRADKYEHTPIHLAGMFGHEHTFQQLVKMTKCAFISRSGTTVSQIKDNFEKYLLMYSKRGLNQSFKILHLGDKSAAQGMQELLDDIDWEFMTRETNALCVDIDNGEAEEVKLCVMSELNNIIGEIGKIDPTYNGELILVGSSSDGTKLFCPDEFDFNVSIKFPDVKVNVVSQEQKYKGEKQVVLMTEHKELQNNRFMSNFYDLLRKCLPNYTLKDRRLSIVPPGLKRTQVGVCLSLAWQGDQYPLLLVGADLVPVLEVPWHQDISRPWLTPEGTSTIHLSNTEDGSWRCSFAKTESDVLKEMDDVERQVLVLSKAILYALKAEAWMPRYLKAHFTWWMDREWKIPVPSGFCLKNSFLECLEEKRKREDVWAPEEVLKHVEKTFRNMCEMLPSTELQARNKLAYFGGDCEPRKEGSGAPVLVQYLSKIQQL